MIFQLHYQNARDPTDQKTEFVAQSGDVTDQDQMFAWVKGVYERHPLPDGKMWLVCDEQAPMFMRMHPDGKCTIVSSADVPA